MKTKRPLVQPVLPLTFEQNQPHQQFQAQPSYLANGSGGPASGAQALLPNNGRVIQSGATRVLCVADVRGKLFVVLAADQSPS